MINGVLAPYSLKKLVVDVVDQRFSLLNESTDVSVSKYLGVVIRYFSDTKQTIVSTFLGLVGGRRCQIYSPCCCGFP